MIDAISALGASAALPQVAALTPQASSPTADVVSLFEGQFNKVNTDLATSEQYLQKLAGGEPVELHDVMISLETARIGVQTMIQVRNRMIEAYQELMRMQI